MRVTIKKEELLAVVLDFLKQNGYVKSLVTLEEE
jgi:hypothetical protein